MSKLKAKKPEETKPGKIKMMIFSKSGIGKTWFSLDFPNPFYVDSEGGADLGHYQAKLAKAGGGYLGIEDGALDFPTVLEQIQALATETHKYKTLVITITKLFQTAIANEAERLKVNGKKDEFGISKKPAIAYMRRLVNWINRLDMNVLFEAHEISEWGLVNGNREEIGNQADVWDKLIYELDLTLRFVKHGLDRVAVIRKSRLLGFPEGDSFPIEENIGGYEEFGKRYGIDFIESEVKSITMASKEQVEEIEHILSKITINEKDIKKILSKASAESWAELSDKQAESTIIWLKKKLEV